MTAAARRTLLCVGNFDRQTGYAWDTIRLVWRAVALELAPLGVRTLAVYRGEPRGLGIGGNPPVELIDGGWREPADLAALCRAHGVQACWLTDTAVLSRLYGELRRAGVEFVAVHERTSGERTVPGAVRGTVKRLLARRPGWSADRYIAISEFVRRRLLETACLPQAKVERVYNAVDLDRWKAPVETARVRERLGLTPRARLVACTCRAQAVKGVDTLIAAISRLPDDVHGVHSGDGPDLPGLRRQVADAGLEHRFQLLGHGADVHDLIGAADAVAVPSRWQEGFGLAVIEGLAAGRPVVASAVGAIPELIEDQRTGLLVPPDDPAALARALSRVLDDRDLALRLARAGQADAQHRFGMPRLARELTALFAAGMRLEP